MVIAIAEDMKKMAENIISSYDVRVKALGNLVTDTHETLEGFASDRKKMGEKQAKDLADFVQGLSKNVQTLLKKAQEMIAEFHKSTGQMRNEQVKNLADFVNTLTNNVNSMLSAFEKDRNKMSKELKDKLTREVRDIQTQVEKILDDADKLIGEFSSDMAQAKKAWKDTSAVLSKARKGGFVTPRVEAKEKVTTVAQAISKGKGKKKFAKKA